MFSSILLCQNLRRSELENGVDINSVHITWVEKKQEHFELKENYIHYTTML
jgi:hypothetical protein